MSDDREEMRARLVARRERDGVASHDGFAGDGSLEFIISDELRNHGFMVIASGTRTAHVLKPGETVVYADAARHMKNFEDGAREVTEALDKLAAAIDERVKAEE